MTGLFPVALTENDVRRLCGATAFRWGDTWQREGHVTEPAVGPGGLGASVLGAWRRIDHATVSVTGSQIRSSCTCSEGDLCRHAAALLLQWLRQPRSFGHAEPGTVLDSTRLTPSSGYSLGLPLDDLDEMDDLDDEDPAESEVQTATQEFARLLDTDIMQNLRDIARKRGVRVTARNKVELVQQLASILGEPNSVDAALDGLNDNQRLTLEVIALVRVGSAATAQTIGAAYQALDGQGELQAGVPSAVERLLELGLIFPADRYTIPSHSYSIPQVVSNRLAAGSRDAGPIGRKLRVRDARQVLKEMNRFASTNRAQTGPGTGLVLAELFPMIVNELTSGRVGADMQHLSAEETKGVPHGWRRDLTQRMDGHGKRRQAYGQQYVRLYPLPSVLSNHDLNHLSKIAGQPVRMISFALLLMGALGIIESEATQNGYTYFILEDRLHDLLALPSPTVTAVMVNAWLAMGDQLELGTVANAGGPIELNYVYTPYYYAGWSLPQPKGQEVRRVVARVVGRLTASAETRDAWYDFGDFSGQLWNVSPGLLSPPSTGQPPWWFSTRSQPETRLKLERREDWQRVWRPVVEAIMAGPMTWLGLVEVAMGKEGAIAFRSRPRAATLIAQQIDEAESQQSDGDTRERRPEVDLQQKTPVVFVPSGRSHTAIYSMLSSFSEMVDASPRGLSYQLSPERLQALFDIGMTGAKMIELLVQYGDERLAETLGPTLQEWWAGYGTVRLYDDLTLIELGDDILLREILASSRLQDALVYTFSPRLIAVRPAHVDALVAELNRLGYTPRVTGEG